MPPPAAANTSPPRKPPNVAQPNRRDNDPGRRPFTRNPNNKPPNNKAPNSNARAPATAPPRQVINPTYPVAPGAVRIDPKNSPAISPNLQARPPADPRVRPSYQRPQRPAGARRPSGTPPPNLDAIRRQRQQIVAPRSNAVVIKEPDNRMIVKRNNRSMIMHNEANRLRRVDPNARVERRNGQNVTVIQRPNNTEIYNITDDNGRLVRRYRRDNDGREYDIIDNRRENKSRWRRNLAIGVGVGAGLVAGAAILNSMVDVPAPRVGIPRDKYVVDYDDANEDEVYEAFNAPPVDDIERRYTLDEVRATRNLRERMRRVDLSDITFDTGSWEVEESQYHMLERAARAMMRVIERDPNEVFLIEGYTDAVGSEDDNLTLSDRRAELVAVILSEEFGVPPENLTTQGYGEQYLKYDTSGPERANRRVALRRITPLIADRGRH